MSSAEAQSRSGEGASTSGRDDGNAIGQSHAKKDVSREWYRFLNAVIRGAGAGLCLRGGLNLLSWLFALLSKSRRNRLALNPLRVLLDQFIDTVRYTLFLGSLSGVYVAADECLAHQFGRQRCSPLSAQAQNVKRSKIAMSPF
jgi:hypothetical protein